MASWVAAFRQPAGLPERCRGRGSHLPAKEAEVHLGLVLDPFADGPGEGFAEPGHEIVVAWDREGFSGNPGQTAIASEGKGVPSVGVHVGGRLVSAPFQKLPQLACRIDSFHGNPSRFGCHWSGCL